MARMLRYNNVTQGWEPAQWLIPGTRPLVVIDGIPVRFWGITFKLLPKEDLTYTQHAGQVYHFKAPGGWMMQADLQLCRAAGPDGGEKWLRVQMVVADRVYATTRSGRPLLMFYSKPGTATWKIIKE